MILRLYVAVALPALASAEPLAQQLGDLRKVIANAPANRSSPAEKPSSMPIPEFLSLQTESGRFGVLTKIPGHNAFLTNMHVLAGHSPEALAGAFKAHGDDIQQYHFFELFRCGRPLDLVLVVRKDSEHKFLSERSAGTCAAQAGAGVRINPDLQIFQNLTQKGQEYFAFHRPGGAAPQVASGVVSRVEESSCSSALFLVNDPSNGMAVGSSGSLVFVRDQATGAPKIGGIVECIEFHAGYGDYGLESYDIRVIPSSELLNSELRPTDPARFQFTKPKPNGCFPIEDGDGRGGGG